MQHHVGGDLEGVAYEEETEEGGRVGVGVGGSECDDSFRIG